MPVGGQRHVEAVDGLQADEHAFDLVEVTAQRQRIVDHGADRGVGVDEEDGSDGRRRTFARLDHAVEVGDFHPQIGDQREAHLDVLHSAVDDLVADRAQPCDVAVQSVDRESDELAVERFEFVAARREGHEFGGTDGREVRRVAEKDDPASGIIFRKADRALRSDGLERRGLVADAREWCSDFPYRLFF